jgi:putative YphP/YqiW family bacilliredoxin
MPYPESFIGPTRKGLTRLGVQELRTAEAVDAVVRQKSTTVMVVAISMSGCAAGKARPGVALALRHLVEPDGVATVFAGGDIEATERVRSYCAEHPPSSPSVAILRDGQLLCMMGRHQIENQTAETIARDPTDAFDTFCAPNYCGAGAGVVVSCPRPEVARGLR